MLRKLKELVYMNRYPQLSASELEALREDTNEVMLLPSSNDYGWFTSFESGESYISNAEVITLGRARYANIKYCNGPFISSNNHIIETKDKNQLRTRYLYNFLSYTSKTYYVESTSYPKFEKDIFENTTLDVPEVSVQDARIKELDLLNNAIFGEKRRLSEFDSLIKSRFNEMFSNYKVITRLGDLANICRGASPRPISSFITKDDSGINWIKIGDVDTNAIYITKTEEKITKEGANKSRMVYKGDFILSNSMSFGRPYILGINGCVHDGWLIISNYQKHFEPLFLYYSLRSDDVQSQFEHDASGTTVKNLNSDIVKNTFVITSPLKEQKEFSSFVEHIDKLKFNCQQRIKLYQELLNKKMDEYFG